jgi:hypothetical protein
MTEQQVVDLLGPPLATISTGPRGSGAKRFSYLAGNIDLKDGKVVAKGN